jgi:signal transduction histidine kinase
MASKQYDLFVFDFRLPDGDGIQLLREVRGAGVDTPTLFVTTASSAKLAVEAMKLGADDYLVKEEGYLAVLPFLIEEVLRRRRLVEERKVLEERLQRAERAATMGYLASGLAHHINNPLATIRTFLQLLPTHYEDTEFRTGYLQMALAESERIRDLVKDIMRATTVPNAGTEVHAIGDLVTRAEESITASVAANFVLIVSLRFTSDPRPRPDVAWTVFECGPPVWVVGSHPALPKPHVTPGTTNTTRARHEAGVLGRWGRGTGSGCNGAVRTPPKAGRR